MASGLGSSQPTPREIVGFIANTAEWLHFVGAVRGSCINFFLNYLGSRKRRKRVFISDFMVCSTRMHQEPLEEQQVGQFNAISSALLVGLIVNIGQDSLVTNIGL